MIEQWGTGTTRILEWCHEVGLPEPEFREEAGGFRVVFLKDPFTPERLRALGLKKRQVKAVLYVKSHGSISNKEYRDLSGVKERTATLELYLCQRDNRFQKFDWWFFSKVDESLDEVYIPYYDPKSNRIARFKPDFIFWLYKGDRYWIVFVDPKGTEHVDYQRKIDGYRGVFLQDGQPRAFLWNAKTVTVHLFFHTDDLAKIPEPYRQFWFDKVEDVPEKLLNF